MSKVQETFITQEKIDENEEKFKNKVKEDVEVTEKVRKLHRITNHKSKNNMEFIYKQGGKDTLQVKKAIDKVVDSCDPCQKRQRSKSRPRIAFPRAKCPNDIVTMDISFIEHQSKTKPVLWFVDSFSRYALGKPIKSKEAVEVVHEIEHTWNNKMGIPGTGYYSDNGGDFNNKILTEFITEKLGRTLEFTPPYSPFSNGKNEKNHFAADQVVKKLIAEDPKMSLEDAVSKGAWTHNYNANKHGTTPLQLMTGKNATFPGITERSSNQEASEYVLQMLRSQETFRKAEYASKIKEAENAAYIPSYHDEFYDENDWVFVQEHDK